MGWCASPIKAPRFAPMRPDLAAGFIRDYKFPQALVQEIGCAFAVINAAGNPDASSLDADSLTAVNGVLPGVLARAVAQSQAMPRFVHVSSTVVQARARVLDDSPAQSGFSPYSRSKALGELLVSQFGGTSSVTYRPPSVHGPDRRVTRMTARIAASPFASVARPGSAPTPQTLVHNVGSAVAFIATTDLEPPPLVTHPSEGMTTAQLMEILGRKSPHLIPRWIASALVGLLSAGGRVLPPMAANARRVEMLWFGQPQARSWLDDAGWQKPAGVEAWLDLGTAMRRADIEPKQWM